MSDLFLIPVLTLLAAATSLITAKDVLFIRQDEKKPREILKKKKPAKTISISGYILLACALATVGLSYWQQVENKKEIKKANRQAQTDLDKRDSLNNLRLEKSKNETIDALARYGLKYDSSTNQIKNFIKDSSGVKNKASVGVCLDGSGFSVISNAPIMFDMRICNYRQDHADNFNMIIGYVLIKDGKPAINKLYKIPNGVRISSEKPYLISDFRINNTDVLPALIHYMFSYMVHIQVPKVQISSLYQNFLNMTKKLMRSNIRITNH